MTETTIPTNNATNENSISENNSSNENSVSENHKYDSSKNHLENCESCRIIKKKINDDYYANNTDKILLKRKTDRESKQNKLNNAINDPKVKPTLTNKDLDLVSSIPIEEINPENYMLKQTSKFIFPKGSEKLMKKYSMKKVSRGLILIGHAGNGKTELPKAYSIKNKIPTVFTSVNDDMRSTDLLGSFSLKENSSIFLLGNIPKAIEIANSHPSKMCILILDELNCAGNNVQKLFNMNLDFRSGINIPLVNKTYRLNDDSKIIVIGTMNYSSYTGTYPLNLELNSRFDFKEIKNMPDKLIKELLKSQNIDQQTIDSLLITQKEILKAFEEGKIDQPLDPRGLLKFAEDYNLNISEFNYSKQEAIQEAIELTLVGRYLDNREDLKFVKEIIESNFNTEEEEDQTEKDPEINSGD